MWLHHLYYFFLQFEISLTNNSNRPAKIYKVKMTRVAEINPEYPFIIIILCLLLIQFSMLRVLKRFIAGEQSHDNSVLTAITVDITKLSLVFVAHMYYRH